MDGPIIVWEQIIAPELPSNCSRIWNCWAKKTSSMQLNLAAWNARLIKLARANVSARPSVREQWVRNSGVTIDPTLRDDRQTKIYRGHEKTPNKRRPTDKKVFSSEGGAKWSRRDCRQSRGWAEAPKANVTPLLRNNTLSGYSIQLDHTMTEYDQIFQVSSSPLFWHFTFIWSTTCSGQPLVVMYLLIYLLENPIFACCILIL